MPMVARLYDHEGEKLYEAHGEDAIERCLAYKHDVRPELQQWNVTIDEDEEDSEK